MKSTRLLPRRHRALRPLLWSVLTFALLSGSTAGLSFAAARIAEGSLAAQNRLLAAQIGERIRSCVITRVEIIGTMQRERALGGLRDEGAFAARAQALIGMFPGYLAINWIDPDGVIVRVYPEEENRLALGQRLLDKPSAAAELRRAQETREAMLTVPLELFQGGKGVALYVPSVPNSPSRDVLNGVFRTETLIPACLHADEIADHSLTIRDGEAALYEERKTASAEAFGNTIALPLLNRTWTVRLAPSASLVEKARHPARLLLTGGLTLSASVAILLFGLLVSRARAKESQRRSEEEMRRLVSVVDAADDYVAIVGPDGGLEYVNPAARLLMGLEAEDWRSTSALDLVAPEDLERARAHVARVEAQGSSTAELRMRNARTGAVVPLEFRSFLLAPVEGQTGRSRASVARDLRERRKLEAQLQQAQKMEALGRLAGGVAHDFNNLLSVILLDVDLLRDEGYAEEREQLLDEILEASQRAAALTKDLLGLGRGRTAVLEPIDLVVVVQAMRPLLTRLVRSDIEVEVHTVSAPCVILGSRVQLEQIVVNLVMNAVDAMPEGGHVTIDVRRDADHVCLSVEDTGPGVPPDIVEQIFEPFFTTKGSGAGTGLGLATVYGNVGRMNAAISVVPRPGKGACFVIRFPVWAAPAGANNEPEVVSPKNEPPLPRTVLLVEDTLAVRNSLARMLRRAGVEVLEAENGGAAIELLQRAEQASPDIVLSDVVMPRMGGVELLHWMRAQRPELPMVLMSGYSGDALANVDVAKLGVMLLDKPVNEATLLAKLAEAFAKRNHAVL